MKFWSLLLLSVLLAAINGHSQDKTKKNGLYVRSIINEVNIGYERTLKSVSLSTEFGYQIAYLSEWTYTGGQWGPMYLAENLAYHGYSGRFMVNISTGKKFKISPLIGWQTLKANELINDPGKASQQWESTYQVYSQENVEFIGQLLFFAQPQKYKWLQIYFGAGLRVIQYSQQYSIEGTTRNPQPSNRTEEGNSVIPTVHFGLKFTFVRF